MRGPGRVLQSSDPTASWLARRPPHARTAATLSTPGGGRNAWGSRRVRMLREHLQAANCRPAFAGEGVLC